MQGEQSRIHKEGQARISTRALLKGAGFTDEEIAKPFIGIACSWTDSFPGHKHLNELAQDVAKGVYVGGGTPMIFNTIAICDGYCGSTPGAKYSLPSRELIADSVESMAIAHGFDALVLVCACDKIVPGMLNAAARLDLPAIVVTGGPMLPGNICGQRESLATIHAATRAFNAGKMTAEEYREREDKCMPGCGSCAGMYTANSMGCITEVIGMQLPGGGTIPAVYAERERLAKESGKQIMELWRRNVKPSDIITRASLLNAITVDMMLGCSTNTQLHLTALAHELGLTVTLEDFDERSQHTPMLCSLSPSGSDYLSDLYEAGGIQAVLKEGLDNGLIDGSPLTVSLQSVAENVKDAKIRNYEVIHPVSAPLKHQGGLRILRGNLAPDGAIAKASAIAEHMQSFTGNAVCFDSEEDAKQAVLDRRFKDGDIIVLRYEGPKGGPGMQEMARLITLVQSTEYGEKIPLITDGRFSGMTRGASIGHISPEAAAGGPLALVKDGDRIHYDVNEKVLEVLISDEELEARRKAWKAPEPKVKTGWLARYAKLVTSADKGAVLQ